MAENYRSGKLIPLIHAYNGTVADLSGVPSVYDYAKSDEDKQIFGLVYGWRELGRPISAPPGVPPDRLQALRRAFDATIKDSAFLADAKKLELDVQPSSGEEVEKIVAGFLATPRSLVEKANKALIENP
jgi:hypothetical protein